MFRRGVIGALLALAMTATGAQAFQAGVYTSTAHDGVVRAVFVAAPWDRTNLTVRASDGGQTITFHDANGIAGKNPPPATGPGFVSPCQLLDQHTAQCHSSGRLEVFAQLSDGPARYRDLAPVSGTPNPYETVFSGPADDDIAIRYGWYAFIEDAGGSNTLAITNAPSNGITAYNGIRNTIDLRNGAGGDQATCALGQPDRGPWSLEGPSQDDPLIDHGVSDTVLADPGDVVDGCENDLPV